MIDFNKNKLMNKVLENYYSTFSKTLDTADYVPEKYTKKINAYIFKNLKKKFKEINKEQKIFLKGKKQKVKATNKQQRKEKWSKFWAKLKQKKSTRKQM